MSWRRKESREKSKGSWLKDYMAHDAVNNDLKS